MNKTLLWIIIAAVAIFILLLVTDVIDFDSEGDVTLPDVDVEATAEGGSLPEVQVDTADIDVDPGAVDVDLDVDGDLPSVDMDPADDDGDVN
ncbi:MAG: hypothetical protein V2J26_00520 [Pacificimonas sp.]|nr:hypothetical protein [Pacificimonas sp.]